MTRRSARAHESTPGRRPADDPGRAISRRPDRPGVVACRSVDETLAGLRAWIAGLSLFLVATAAAHLGAPARQVAWAQSPPPSGSSQPEDDESRGARVADDASSAAPGEEPGSAAFAAVVEARLATVRTVVADELTSLARAVDEADSSNLEASLRRFEAAGTATARREVVSALADLEASLPADVVAFVPFGDGGIITARGLAVAAGTSVDGRLRGLADGVLRADRSVVGIEWLPSVILGVAAAPASEDFLALAVGRPVRVRPDFAAGVLLVVRRLETVSRRLDSAYGTDDKIAYHIARLDAGREVVLGRGAPVAFLRERLAKEVSADGRSVEFPFFELGDRRVRVSRFEALRGLSGEAVAALGVTAAIAGEASESRGATVAAGSPGATDSPAAAGSGDAVAERSLRTPTADAASGDRSDGAAAGGSGPELLAPAGDAARDVDTGASGRQAPAGDESTSNDGSEGFARTALAASAQRDVRSPSSPVGPGAAKSSRSGSLARAKELVSEWWPAAAVVGVLALFGVFAWIRRGRGESDFGEFEAAFDGTSGERVVLQSEGDLVALRKSVDRLAKELRQTSGSGGTGPEKKEELGGLRKQLAALSEQIAATRAEMPKVVASEVAALAPKGGKKRDKEVRSEVEAVLGQWARAREASEAKTLEALQTRLDAMASSLENGTAKRGGARGKGGSETTPELRRLDSLEAKLANALEAQSAAVAERLEALEARLAAARSKVPTSTDGAGGSESDSLEGDRLSELLSLQREAVAEQFGLLETRLAGLLAERRAAEASEGAESKSSDAAVVRAIEEKLAHLSSRSDRLDEGLSSIADTITRQVDEVLRQSNEQRERPVDAGAASDSGEVEALRAELVAARQQLDEVSRRERDLADRLAEEVAARKRRERESKVLAARSSELETLLAAGEKEDAERETNWTQRVDELEGRLADARSEVERLQRERGEAVASPHLPDEVATALDFQAAVARGGLPHALLAVDAETRVIFCNPAAERLLRADAAEGIGRPVEVLPSALPELRDAIADGVGRTIGEGTARVDSLPLVEVDEDEIHLDAHYELVPSAAGTTLGVVVSLIDRSELAARERDCEVQEIFQDSLIRSIPVALIICDTDHRVIVWNSHAERILKVDESDALGASLLELECRVQGDDFREQLAAARAGGKATRFPVSSETRQGSRYLVTFAPFEPEDGEARGYLLLVERAAKSSRVASS